MKKSVIYALLAAALVILGALTAAYRIGNPDRLIPSNRYTELKARLLTADYRQAAEDLGIEDGKRGSYVYAVMIEYPTPELEKSEKITASFFFFDALNKYAHADSNGGENVAVRYPGDLVSGLTESAAKLFDDTFKPAENTDFGIPDYGAVKLYIRRGDGIYFRYYGENEVPPVLPQSFEEAVKLDEKAAEAAAGENTVK